MRKGKSTAPKFYFQINFNKEEIKLQISFPLAEIAKKTKFKEIIFGNFLKKAGAIAPADNTSLFTVDLHRKYIVEEVDHVCLRTL